VTEVSSGRERRNNLSEETTMKTIAKLLLLGLACAGLSSCLVTTTGLGLQLCYDKACVGVQVPPTNTAVQPAPAMPAASTPWPEPQRMMVKDAGK
jgi:hypothetical protein